MSAKARKLLGEDAPQMPNPPVPAIRIDHSSLQDAHHKHRPFVNVFKKRRRKQGCPTASSRASPAHTTAFTSRAPSPDIEKGVSQDAPSPFSQPFKSASSPHICDDGNVSPTDALSPYTDASKRRRQSRRSHRPKPTLDARPAPSIVREDIYSPTSPSIRSTIFHQSRHRSSARECEPRTFSSIFESTIPNAREWFEDISEAREMPSQEACQSSSRSKATQARHVEAGTRAPLITFLDLDSSDDEPRVVQARHASSRPRSPLQKSDRALHVRDHVARDTLRPTSRSPQRHTGSAHGTWIHSISMGSSALTLSDSDSEQDSRPARSSPKSKTPASTDRDSAYRRDPSKLAPRPEHTLEAREPCEDGEAASISSLPPRTSSTVLAEMVRVPQHAVKVSAAETRRPRNTQAKNLAIFQGGDAAMSSNALNDQTGQPELTGTQGVDGGSSNDTHSLLPENRRQHHANRPEPLFASPPLSTLPRGSSVALVYDSTDTLPAQTSVGHGQHDTASSRDAETREDLDSSSTAKYLGLSISSTPLYSKHFAAPAPTRSLNITTQQSHDKSGRTSISQLSSTGASAVFASDLSSADEDVPPTPSTLDSTLEHVLSPKSTLSPSDEFFPPALSINVAVAEVVPVHGPAAPVEEDMEAQSESSRGAITFYRSPPSLTDEDGRVPMPKTEECQQVSEQMRQSKIRRVQELRRMFSHDTRPAASLGESVIPMPSADEATLPSASARPRVTRQDSDTLPAVSGPRGLGAGLEQDPAPQNWSRHHERRETVSRRGGGSSSTARHAHSKAGYSLFPGAAAVDPFAGRTHGVRRTATG